MKKLFNAYAASSVISDGQSPYKPDTSRKAQAAGGDLLDKVEIWLAGEGYFEQKEQKKSRETGK